MTAGSTSRSARTSTAAPSAAPASAQRAHEIGPVAAQAKASTQTASVSAPSGSLAMSPVMADSGGYSATRAVAAIAGHGGAGPALPAGRVAKRTSTKTTTSSPIPTTHCAQ